MQNMATYTQVMVPICPSTFPRDQINSFPRSTYLPFLKSTYCHSLFLHHLVCLTTTCSEGKRTSPADK